VNIDIIGVPIDLGANRRGVDMGPSAIRYAGLKQSITKLGIACKDLGNVYVPVSENIDDNPSDKNLRHLHEISKVNETLMGRVSASISGGNMPIVLGGDHSIAVGTLLGAQSVLKNIGVIWMDAHGDFNTQETTLSGNLHGMSLAAAAGTGVKEMTRFKPEDINYINPEKVALVGVRDLDNEEAKLLKRSGVTVFTMADIDASGIKEIMKRALNIVESGTEGFHLSFDIDVINPNEAPGVGTPVYGGLTYREAHLASEMISDSGKLCSADFVEVNPILDNMNRTGQLAVSLICSVVGKKIFNIA